jgi:hypothetical protein
VVESAESVELYIVDIGISGIAVFEVTNVFESTVSDVVVVDSGNGVLKEQSITLQSGIIGVGNNVVGVTVGGTVEETSVIEIGELPVEISVVKFDSVIMINKLMRVVTKRNFFFSIR